MAVPVCFRVNEACPNPTLTPQEKSLRIWTNCRSPQFCSGSCTIESKLSTTPEYHHFQTWWGLWGKLLQRWIRGYMFNLATRPTNNVKRYLHMHGRKIEVQSDHRPLSYIASLLEHSPWLARWNLILRYYDISSVRPEIMHTLNSAPIATLGQYPLL